MRFLYNNNLNIHTAGKNLGTIRIKHFKNDKMIDQIKGTSCCWESDIAKLWMLWMLFSDLKKNDLKTIHPQSRSFERRIFAQAQDLQI